MLMDRSPQSFRFLLLLLWFFQGRCSELPDNCGIPGPARNLTVRGEDHSRFILEWRAPANVGASCVDGYQVCLSKQYNEAVVCYDAWQTSLQVNDVFQSRQCSFFTAQVSTIAVTGEVTAITNTSLHTAPRAIVDLEAKNTTCNSTVLKWNLPPIASCADHYVLTVCTAENATSTTEECSQRRRALGRFIWESERVQLAPCRYNRVEVAVANTQEARAGEELVLKTGNSEPPAVSNLTVKVESAYIFSLKWARPRGMDSRCTPGYKVCYGLKGSENHTCALADKETWDNKHSNKTVARSTYTATVASVDAVLSLDSLASEVVKVDFHTGAQRGSRLRKWFAEVKKN